MQNTSEWIDSLLKCNCGLNYYENDKTHYADCAINARQPILARIAAERAEATVEGIEHVLRTLHSEEGRLRQVANTVFYAAETISELKGEKPVPLEEFGSYKDYLANLAQSKPKEKEES